MAESSADSFATNFEAQLEVRLSNSSFSPDYHPSIPSLRVIQALSQIETLEAERAELLKVRQINSLQAVQETRKKHESNKGQLKSDLKKSNALVKKLKIAINSEGIQQCIRDVDTLNLYLFISEIVNSIVATTYKATETSNMVKFCACLHQRYPEFTRPLVNGLKHALLSPPAEDDNEAGKRRRIQVHL